MPDPGDDGANGLEQRGDLATPEPRQVRIERRGPVALVTLDRPDKRNALSIALRRELAAALRALAADAAVSVAVLTGAGSAFCAGMDRTEFGGSPDHRRNLFESSRGLFAALRELPIPAIAAINGPALGGGFALAAACDLRLASPAARLGHPEVTFGIPASYAALVGVVPEQVARELAYTGRVISADEALALGAVREIAADPVARGIDLGKQMARLGRGVLEATKRIVLEAARTGAAARASEAEWRMFHQHLFPGS